MISQVSLSNICLIYVMKTDWKFDLLCSVISMGFVSFYLFWFCFGYNKGRLHQFGSMEVIHKFVVSWLSLKPS